MTKKPLEINEKNEEFLDLLKKNVIDVLESKRTKTNERVQAVHAGLKLLQIEHKIGGGDEENFFSK